MMPHGVKILLIKQQFVELSTLKATQSESSFTNRVLDALVSIYYYNLTANYITIPSDVLWMSLVLLCCQFN